MKRATELELAMRPMQAGRRGPAYPTWLTVQANPAVLRRHVPPAWRRHAKLGILVGTLLGSTMDGPPSATGEATLDLLRNLTHSSAAKAEVRIFGFGPAFYLSEQDARRIIIEELALNGIRLPLIDQTLPTVIISGHEVQWLYNWTTRRYAEKRVPVLLPLVADMMDAERGIAIEYVDRWEYDLLGGTEEFFLSDAELRQHAAMLCANVQQQAPGLHFWAFYCETEPWHPPRDLSPLRSPAGSTQPTTAPGTATTSAPATAPLPVHDERYEIARDRLRVQICDFVDWLEAQGLTW